MSDLEANWYWSDQGTSNGPITRAEIQALVQSGRVQNDTPVWHPTQTDWVPYARSALAPTLTGAAPVFTAQNTPPIGGQGPYAPQFTPHSGLAPIEVVPLILLSIITCGIYGLVMFYQSVVRMLRLTGAPSNFRMWFWVHVLGNVVANGTLSALTAQAQQAGDIRRLQSLETVSMVLGVVLLGVGIMTLLEALKARSVLSSGLRVGAALLPNVGHILLWTLGALTTSVGFLLNRQSGAEPTEAELLRMTPFLLLGLGMTIFQAVRWFTDYNTLSRAFESRNRGF